MDSTRAGARVLVVDDEEGIRRLVTGILTRQGCVVTAAADGFAAIALLEQGSVFETVLTDFDLPGRNGLEVLRAKQAYLPAARGVLMTSLQIGDRILAEVRELGATFLAKPFSLQDIQSAVLGRPPL